MQTNVLEYLENTVDRVPDKTAFADEESALSFIQVSEQAKSIGTEQETGGIICIIENLPVGYGQVAEVT